MIQLGQSVGPKSPPKQNAVGDAKSPRCCGQEMYVLLKRAVLHSDGTVDFRVVWGCSDCGRRIL
jgi:hypothetical protein